MYIKIPNVSTITKPRICYIVCCSKAFNSIFKIFLKFEKAETITNLRSFLLVPANSAVRRYSFCGIRPEVQERRKVRLFKEPKKIFRPGQIFATLSFRSGFLSFTTTADAMASAGINCCSTVCQHKCM